MQHRTIEITTLRTLACPDRLTCPSTHRLQDRPGMTYVILKKVTDEAEAAAFAHLMADDEILGFAPDELFRGHA